MPVEKAKVLKLIEMMDNYLKQREQDQLEGVDDEDPDTDPIEFQETYSARVMPVAEPPDPLTDSPPQRIHGEPRKDLFK